MAAKDILILGAGPAGMSAALALAIQAAKDGQSPLNITIIELRASLETIGGTINMTPLGMKYLDYLGAGRHLRPHCIELKHGLDYIALRTGKSLGNIWNNIGCVRVARHVLVESLFKAIQEDFPMTITFQWHKKIVDVQEEGEKVILTLEDGAKISGDAVIAGDGIHSIARRKWVEPDRLPRYHGRVVTMGWSDADGANRAQSLLLPDGSPALQDTTLFFGSNGILLTSYWEPTRTKVYFAHIHNFDLPESGDTRDGWKALANDQEWLTKEISEAYNQGPVRGISELISSCEKWNFWPINILPGKGRWSRGKVLLIGDAAHAMPPQGESTGLAIEDGVLVGHVFSRRDTRNVETLFEDFEVIRKPVIDKHYDSAIWSMEHGLRKNGWLMGIVIEWMTWAVLLYRRWTQEDHFSSNVRTLKLPD